MKLHHIGIVSHDLEKVRSFCQVFDLETTDRGFVERYQADCLFVDLNNIRLEFIFPQGGLLKNYNKGLGGIHHIAIQVDNLKETEQRLMEQDVRMIELEGIKGAIDILVNFIPPTEFGYTIELVQIDRQK